MDPLKRIVESDFELKTTNLYRKKPVVIEAVKYNGNNVMQIIDFTGCGVCDVVNGVLSITTLESSMRATAGDYIIKGIKGEFYPCKPDIF